MMNATKSRAQHAGNQVWIKRLNDLIGRKLDERLVEGDHGTIALTIVVRDGLIQYVEDCSKTTYK